MKWKLGPDGHKQVGCLHQSLFEILLSNIVTDELHLMLRVMDRLETGLILKDVVRDEVNYIFRCLIILRNSKRVLQEFHFVMQFTFHEIQADNQGKPPSKRYFPHLDALLAIIHSLRISLNMWKTRESSRTLKRTSSLGREKWLLLEKLPCHFTSFCT